MDETSALEEGQWRNGRSISYEDYLKMSSIQEQTARQAFELSKWRTAMQIRLTDQEEPIKSKTIIWQYQINWNF